MTPADAAREVARLAREAVLALRDGAVLDLARREATAWRGRARQPARRALRGARDEVPARARSSGPSATTSRSAPTSSRSGRCGSTRQACDVRPASPTAAGRLRAQDEPGDLHEDRPRGVHAEPGGLHVRRDQVERRRAAHDVPEGLPARSACHEVPRHGATGFLGRTSRARSRARATRWRPLSRTTGGDVLDAAGVRAAADGCDGRVPLRRQGLAEAPRTPRSSTACTSRARRRLVDACAAAGVRRVVVASSERHRRRERERPITSRTEERRAAHRPLRPLAVLPREALRRARGARAQRQRARGREREPEPAPRPGRRARLVDRGRAPLPRGRHPRRARGRPLVRRRARRGRGAASSRWSAGGRASATSSARAT